MPGLVPGRAPVGVSGTSDYYPPIDGHRGIWSSFGKMNPMNSTATFFRILSALAILVCASSPLVQAQKKAAAGKQVEQSLKVDDTLAVPYLLALPMDYGKEAGKKWPVILFLHGRGESNGPLSVVAKWGPPRFAARGDDFPYIVISPQCPRETDWKDPEQQAGVLAVLDDTLAKFDCDPSRIYLTGLSMGGYGSWSLAAKHPDRFAAVAPICGGGNPEYGSADTGSR